MSPSKRMTASRTIKLLYEIIFKKSENKVYFNWRSKIIEKSNSLIIQNALNFLSKLRNYFGLPLIDVCLILSINDLQEVFCTAPNWSVLIWHTLRNISRSISLARTFRGKTSLTRIQCVKLRLIEPAWYAFLLFMDRSESVQCYSTDCPLSKNRSVFRAHRKRHFDSKRKLCIANNASLETHSSKNEQVILCLWK